MCVWLVCFGCGICYTKLMYWYVLETEIWTVLFKYVDIQRGTRRHLLILVKRCYRRSHPFVEWKYKLVYVKQNGYITMS